MRFPKVNFKNMSLDENIDLVKWAYYDNGLLNIFLFWLIFLVI